MNPQEQGALPRNETGFASNNPAAQDRDTWITVTTSNGTYRYWGDPEEPDLWDEFDQPPEQEEPEGEEDEGDGDETPASINEPPLTRKELPKPRVEKRSRFT